jgi:hypothetical protein
MRDTDIYNEKHRVPYHPDTDVTQRPSWTSHPRGHGANTTLRNGCEVG